MKSSTRGTIPVIFFIFVIIAIAPLGAAAEAGALIPSAGPARGSADVGLLFSTDNLLFGLSSYQGGLGFIVNTGGFGFRGLLDIVVNGSSQSFLGDLGLSVTYDLWHGPIAPYVGGFAVVGYVTQTSVSSAVTFSVGALIGVQIFVLDFLSFFAEYDLGVDLSYTTDLQTSLGTFDYLAGTRLGNSARLGVVVYFMRSGQKAK
jgi:hypothetical protein